MVGNFVYSYILIHKPSQAVTLSALDRVMDDQVSSVSD